MISTNQNTKILLFFPLLFPAVTCPAGTTDRGHTARRLHPLLQRREVDVEGDRVPSPSGERVPAFEPAEGQSVSAVHESGFKEGNQ